MEPTVSDAAVTAAYNVFVTIARDGIDRIEFDIEELPRIISRIKKESDAGKILIFTSYIEDRMFYILKNLMINLNKGDEDRIFGNNGPFGTFSNKISLSYHLGWLSEIQKHKLNALRKIRNSFAHEAFSSSLTDECIRSQIRIIEDGTQGRLNHLIAAVRPVTEGEERLRILDREISEESMFLCSLAFLSGDTFVELLSWHAAQHNNISPYSLVEQTEIQSTVINKLQTAAAKAVLYGLGFGP